MYTPTKEIVSRNLKKFLAANNMTQAELAQAIGVHPSSVTQWIKEQTSPRAGMVDKICRVFKITKDEFLKNFDEQASFALAKTIPMYNSIHAELHNLTSTVERYISVDQFINADFAVRVVSPSMADVGIEYGDVAFFSNVAPGADIVEGRIYAVWSTDTESVAFKRVFVNGDALILISEHKDFYPICLDSSRAYIIGELTGLYKPIDQEKKIKSRHAKEWEHLYKK